MSDQAVSILCLGFIGILASLLLVNLVPHRYIFLRNITTLSPFLTFLLYGAYEYAMPERYNIRLDLFIIAPLIFLIVLTSMIRFSLRKLKAGKHGTAKPE